MTRSLSSNFQINRCGNCAIVKCASDPGFKVFTFKNPYLGNTCVPFLVSNRNLSMYMFRLKKHLIQLQLLIVCVKYNCYFDFSTGPAPTPAQRRLRSQLGMNNSCRQESRFSFLLKTILFV